MKRKGVAKAYTKNKRKVAPSNTRRLKALIRETVKRVSEPKTKTANFGKVEMYHNCFYSGTPVNTGYVALINDQAIMPQQNGSDSGRIGDQIYVSGFRLKLLLGQKADRPNITFRYFVFSVPKSSSINYGNWFINTTGNVLLDDPNYDFVKVHKSGFWRPNEASLATTTKEYTFTKRIVVPYKKLLKFGPADGATTHNDSDLYLSVMCYDAYGTLISDNIAYAQVSMEMSYKDP